MRKAFVLCSLLALWWPHTAAFAEGPGATTWLEEINKDV
jgi:hypothetical protein